MNTSKRAHLLLNALLLLGLTLTISNFISSYKILYTTGSSDLRNRIVGARVAILGIDPYFFHWQPDQPDTLLDPLADPRFPPSRLTITPTTLLTHLPLAYLPYILLIKYWYLIQWLLLLLTILLFSNTASTSKHKKIVLVLGLFFAGSYPWLSNLRLGQIYILYMFVFSLSYWLYFNKHTKQSAVALGVLIAFRPTYLLSLIPFLIAKKHTYLLNSFATSFTTILLTSLSLSANVWKNYFDSMIILGQGSTYNTSNHFNPLSVYPRVIEDINFLWKNRAFDPFDYSLKTLSQKFLNLKPSIFALISTWLIWLTALISISRQHLKKPKPAILFLISSFLVLTTDFFLPAAYYYYHLIQWLVPLALLTLSLADVSKQANILK